MKKFLRKYRQPVKSFLIFAAIVLVGFIFAMLPPGDYPVNTTLTIKKNTGLTAAAEHLAEKGVIRSKFLYKGFSVLFGGVNPLKAGSYYLGERQSALVVAYRTSRGIQGLSKIKVTIPEGSSSHEIAWLILKNIPEFDAPGFLAEAKKYEGYLFPDTYFFYPNVKPDEVIDTLRNTFEDRIKDLESRMRVFGRSKDDIIKMASIVEKEALTREDRKIVAGILWRRMETGMALQVDFPFYYFYGKTSAQLSLDDLRADSPYNTYTNKGLPPTPVSNPGLKAIEDTMTPSELPYLFYLSDNDGKMHYATTHNGHVENKEMYLR